MAGFGVRHAPVSVFAMRRFRRSPWSEIRTARHGTRFELAFVTAIQAFFRIVPQ
jgi:hypothetical protein